MNVRRSLVCGVLSAGTLACSSVQHPQHQRVDDSVIASDDLALEVENHNWSDVLIYVVHDGSRTRFTQVTATKSLTMRIPPSLVGSNGTVRFLVHRIGGHDDSMAPAGGPAFAAPPDDYLSPVVSVRTGYSISLTLESNLQRSTVGVW